MTTESWVPMSDELKPTGVFGIIDRILAWIVAVGLLLLTAILLVQVVSRYALRQPTVWSEETAIGLFVWVALLAVPLGFRRGEHLTIDFLVRRLSARATKVNALLIAAVCVITLAIIGWLAVELLPVADRQMLTGIVNGLGIPARVSWVYAAIPVGCALSIVFVLERVSLLFLGKVEVLNEDTDRLIVHQLDAE